jgi:hypothetical protein
MLCAMDGKIEQHMVFKFCMKPGKSATETLEMLRKIFGELSLTFKPFNGFLMTFAFQGWSSVS